MVVHYASHPLYGHFFYSLVYYVFHLILHTMKL